jgi:hypothetical protein
VKLSVHNNYIYVAVVYRPLKEGPVAPIRNFKFLHILPGILKTVKAKIEKYTQK